MSKVNCNILVDQIEAVQVACQDGDAQTNKPTKPDGRVSPLISPLHNFDEASAGSLIR